MSSKGSLPPDDQYGIFAITVETLTVAPTSDRPFLAEFFEDPFPAHAALREAGWWSASLVGGIEVGEGEKVLMFLGAANRDPRQWERPDDYDVSRRTIGHVGFGSGIHQCVGMLLARLEGECVLLSLARKVRSIEITGPEKRRYNNKLRGLASLPVRLQPV